MNKDKEKSGSLVALSISVLVIVVLILIGLFVWGAQISSETDTVLESNLELEI